MNSLHPTGPARNYIRVRATLNPSQANVVCRLLLTAHPALNALRKAGQLQMINAGGQLRVAAVRGGTLPPIPTAADMQALVQAVLTEVRNESH